MLVLSVAFATGLVASPARQLEPIEAGGCPMA